MITTTPKTKELLAIARVSKSAQGILKASEPGRGIAISGKDLKKLMRQSRAKLADIREKYGIPMTVMRRYRATGLQGFQAVDIIWCITGVWIE